MEDIYGTAAYNRAFGIAPLLYDKKNANGQTEKPNTIGTLTGNTLRPTLTAFNMGIDPSQIYKNAGLAGASGSYTGLNNSWNPSGGANDTHEARNARIAALTASGMSDSDARIEADNGFQIAESDADTQSRLAGEYFRATGQVYDPSRQQAQPQSQLQPFQQTQQYQNYMTQSYASPQSQQYQQPRQQLQTFQPQQSMPQTGGLLGTAQAQPQGNQYGLLNPYANSQR